jgi:hypothetical protein
MTPTLQELEVTQEDQKGTVNERTSKEIPMHQHSNSSVPVSEKLGDTKGLPTAIAVAGALRARVAELERQRVAERADARRRRDATTDNIRAMRDQYDAWLRQHFVRTAEAADALGVSPRLLQALAAEGPTTLITSDGRVV